MPDAGFGDRAIDPEHDERQRDELLNRELFTSLKDARGILRRFNATVLQVQRTRGIEAEDADQLL
ncbi:MAG: hypothetical protein AAGJ46_04375 [Planctomycetota bacterium]